MNPIVRKLREGDLRQTGRSEEVVAEVLEDRRLFPLVVAAIADPEPGTRVRAADAVEKITRSRPELLRPWKKDFLKLLAAVEQKEVRWHLAQIVPRLALTGKERRQAFERLVAFLDDDSRIVQAFALQGLADIAAIDPSYRPRAARIVERLAASGIAAVRARARKLLPGLKGTRRDAGRGRKRGAG
jgi:hypothetical protein